MGLGRTIVGCGAVALMTCGVLKADHEQGWYVRAGIGPAWTEEAEISEFPGVIGNLEVEYDLGYRFDIGGGYRFCRWFSAEIETGVIQYYFDDDDSIGDFGDSSAANIPIMANAIFEFPTGTPLVPFVGAGVGVSFTVIDLDDFGGVDGTDSDAVFAYQGILGLRYDINHHWSVNVAYKYLGTTDPSWDVRGSLDDIEMDGASTHAVLAGFSYSF